MNDARRIEIQNEREGEPFLLLILSRVGLIHVTWNQSGGWGGGVSSSSQLTPW